MERPLIDVVVPVYKVEDYLGECIESILGQTYENIRLFLVDDGSPDKCGEICDQYAAKDNRVHVIHKENAGVAMARNDGIDVADAPFIIFADSDDYYEKDAIQHLYDLQQQYDAVNHAVTEGDQRVYGADLQAVYQLLQNDHM